MRQRTPIYHHHWYAAINNNNNNNSHDNVYGAVIMTKVIARVHPVHLMNVDWAPGGHQTLRPGQSTWAVSQSKIGSYHPHPPSPLLLLLSPWADTHFTVPWRVEGWVDLSTAVKVHSPCSRPYITAAVAINTTVRGVIRTWVLSHRSQMR